jgi:hypothetical protein
MREKVGCLSGCLDRFETLRVNMSFFDIKRGLADEVKV